jgi:hypothetical protein
VFQQLPWLKPTGATKMFNAVLTYEGDGGVVKDFNTHADRGDGSRNAAHLDAIRPLLAHLSEPQKFDGVAGTSFDARVAIASNDEALGALGRIKLYSPDQLNPTISMIKRAAQEGKVTDWAIIVPELDAAYQRTVDGVTLSITERQRRKDRPGFAGSERRHRATLEVITQKPDRVAEAGPNADALSGESRGALLLTFAIDPELTDAEREDGRVSIDRVKRAAWPAPVPPESVATLLSLAMPYASAPRGRIGFRVRREEDPDKAIVDRD